MTRPSRGERESIAFSRKNGPLVRPILFNLNLTAMQSSVSPKFSRIGEYSDGVADLQGFHTGYGQEHVTARWTRPRSVADFSQASLADKDLYPRARSGIA